MFKKRAFVFTGFLSQFVIFSFLASFASAHQAKGQGSAGDLEGTRPINSEELRACREKLRKKSLERAEALFAESCKTQNESLRAEGFPFCSPTTLCPERLFLRNSPEPLELSFELKADPANGSLSVELSVPLGSSSAKNAQGIQCQPVRGMEWRRQFLGNAENFFDEILQKSGSLDCVLN